MDRLLCTKSITFYSQIRPLQCWRRDRPLNRFEIPPAPSWIRHVHLQCVNNRDLFNFCILPAGQVDALRPKNRLEDARIKGPRYEWRFLKLPIVPSIVLLLFLIVGIA